MLQKYVFKNAWLKAVVGQYESLIEMKLEH